MTNWDVKEIINIYIYYLYLSINIYLFLIKKIEYILHGLTFLPSVSPQAQELCEVVKTSWKMAVLTHGRTNCGAIMSLYSMRTVQFVSPYLEQAGVFTVSIKKKKKKDHQ